MIKHIKIENEVIECTPHYIITYGYMIGDADADVEEEAKISVDNPYLEEYILAVNKLNYSYLDTDNIKESWNDGLISDSEKDLLTLIIDGGGDKHHIELNGGIISETDLGYYKSEYITLHYINEDGEYMNTEIV